MDMQSQMSRPYGYDQSEDPSSRIYHREEEEHQEVHGAQVYESFALRGGVTGQYESSSYLGESTVPAPEEIIPPGTKVFPVVTSDYTVPVESEPLHDTFYGHEEPRRMSEETRETTSHPINFSDLSDRGESRQAHHMPLDTPVTRTFTRGGDDDEYLGGQRRVNIERPRGLEEDPAAPGGGGSSYLSGVSNYQSKVTDPTQQGVGETGVPGIAESLGRMKVSDESSSDQKPRLGFERDSPTRSHEKDSRVGFGAGGLGKGFPTGSHEFDEKSGSVTAVLGEGHESDRKNEPRKDKDPRIGYGGEAGPGLEKDLPSAHDQFSRELSHQKERRAGEDKPSNYTDKIAYVTSVLTDKAIGAKNVVASKLGYTREGGDREHEGTVVDETPRSATGYGQKVVGTVAEKLTPVYEKVKETGSTVMTKLPLSGGTEMQHGEGKGVSRRDYLVEKLRPGEEDKALSEVIAEKLHLGVGGGDKKTTVKEVEVTVEKVPSEEVKHDEGIVEEGKGGGGMVGKLKGAIPSWSGGRAGEVKSDSSQSLGSTVGTTGFPDSGGAVSTQGRLD